MMAPQIPLTHFAHPHDLHSFLSYFHLFLFPLFLVSSLPPPYPFNCLLLPFFPVFPSSIPFSFPQLSPLPSSFFLLLHLLSFLPFTLPPSSSSFPLLSTSLLLSLHLILLFPSSPPSSPFSPPHPLPFHQPFLLPPLPPISTRHK